MTTRLFTPFEASSGSVTNWYYRDSPAGAPGSMRGMVGPFASEAEAAAECALRTARVRVGICHTGGRRLVHYSVWRFRLDGRGPWRGSFRTEDEALRRGVEVAAREERSSS